MATDVSAILKDRALAATTEGVTIADARVPDRPIVYANAGFERLTGYSSQDVLGRNCRFLQGPGTDADAVARIRQSVRDERDCTVEILNYRKDGTPFWNRLSITPVRGAAGEVTHFIGVQSDVTDRRDAEWALRNANRKLRRALDELKRDLDLAARVQQSLLPTEAPELDGLHVVWKFQPCTQLAGDFLNVFALDDRHVGLYMLDVSGHGASAALLSVTLSRWLSSTPGQSCLFETDAGGGDRYRITSPRRVAEHLNERLQGDTGLRQYFTMVYGVFDIEARTLRYVAAGHPGPLFIPREGNGEATAYNPTSAPIGLLENVVFEEHVLALAPGDRFYLYTDGVTEATNAADEEFGTERLVDVVQASRASTLDGSIRRILDRLDAWQGRASCRDDVSLLGVEID